MSLFNVSEVVNAHHESLVDNDHSRGRVLATLYGPFGVTAIGVGVADWVFPDAVELGSGIGHSLAAAFALLTGVLFGPARKRGIRGCRHRLAGHVIRSPRAAKLVGLVKPWAVRRSTCRRLWVPSILPLLWWLVWCPGEDLV